MTSSRQDQQKTLWTVRDVLSWTTQRFTEKSFSTPLLDAQILVGSVLKMSKVDLYIHMDQPLGPDERTALRELVKRRLAGEPVAYLLNKKSWHYLSLYVDSNVLIPRPETETLLDFALGMAKIAGFVPRRIVDFCTGSGCLALALARAFPNTEVLAVDISEAALNVAERNKQEYGLTNVSLLLGDVRDLSFFKKLAGKFGEFDMVVANPPYVAESEWVCCDREVKDFEPKLALVCAEEGLELGKAIVHGLLSNDLLASQSFFGMELGIGHPSSLFEKHFATQARWGSVFSSHHPLWDLPRDVFFGLRDLDAKERFLCRLSGLGVAQLDSLSDVDADLVKA